MFHWLQIIGYMKVVHCLWEWRPFFRHNMTTAPLCSETSISKDLCCFTMGFCGALLGNVTALNSANAAQIALCLIGPWGITVTDVVVSEVREIALDFFLRIRSLCECYCDGRDRVRVRTCLIWGLDLKTESQFSSSTYCELLKWRNPIITFNSVFSCCFPPCVNNNCLLEKQIRPSPLAKSLGTRSAVKDVRSSRCGKGRLHVKEPLKWDNLVKALWIIQTPNVAFEGCGPLIETAFVQS